ncbi:cysteine--tRNA ligase [Syntrophomonas palmitatica]|uniref:cysteine--tRNA ligase n=1 Tax=Syntrophomonas palmitatica TaxID=402877 RepID=UPI0006CF7697|nr:cysteine--tRNA ligase [Syntrophomonas palmitatica]
MQVYNTLGGRKEELRTLSPHRVKIYVCGPTTYNYIHLGNARPLVVFDSLRRYLEYCGYKVDYVQNFTDVDDKIINRAIEENDDPMALAARYIDEYFVDAQALNIREAAVHPRVSQHIPQIINAVQGLIDKGHAYELEGDVYYRVRSFPAYGRLSGREQEEMLAGARVEVDQRKEDPADFALWKAAKAGEPAWDSPWGPGRPGWHIECSVMSTLYLGDTIDIHGGGSDLIFPHHENEIAQAEALTGKTFVNYWMHNGFITINKEKMSKSAGNFFLLRDILAKFPADVVRYYLIATHYRSPLDFDDGKLEEARRALGRLKNSLLLAQEFLGENVPPDEMSADSEFLNNLAEIKKDFCCALDDDFNTALAMASLFDLAHQLNSIIAKAEKTEENCAAVYRGMTMLKELGNVLGIFFTSALAQDLPVEDLLQIFTELRQEARQEKNYALADELRDFLTEQGIKLEDTAQGNRYRFEAAPSFESLVDKLLSLRSYYKQEKQYKHADYIRDRLQEAGILVEDTREGARWKFAEA